MRKGKQVIDLEEEKKLSKMSKEERKAYKKAKQKANIKNLAGLMMGAKKFLPLIIVAMVLLIVMVLVAIYSPTLMSELTNTIVLGSTAKNIDMKEVVRIAVTLIILYAISALSGLASDIMMTVVANKFSQNLRSRIVDKINKLPLAYFDHNATGDIMSRLTNDVDSIAQTLQQTLATVVHSACQLVGVLIIMFITSWQMALVTLAALPLILIALIFIMKVSQPQFKKRTKRLGILEGVAEENCNGQSIIKLFNAQDKKKAEFNKANTDLTRALFKSEVFGGLNQPIMNLVSYMDHAAVLLVGGLLLSAGVANFSMGTITAFMQYVNLFQSPLTQLGQSMNVIQSAAAAASRVSEFLNEEELINEDGKERKLDINNIKGKVEFDHVHFSYDSSREIIKDFSAKIEPGMKVAIVGPTGAGKTTMVNLLMRFYETNKGSIKIDDVDIKDMPRSEIHSLFAMVLQDTWIFEGTYRENLAYNTPNLTDDEIYAKIKEAHLVHFTRNLPGHLDYQIGEDSAISGGQKQLITIARAMLKNAPLVILDEATSNVDTRTEEKVQESMDRLLKDKTSFIIAHRLSTIKNADLILVMKDGNIIEQGTHESLMDQNGFYASLYNSQFTLEGDQQE